MKVNMTPNPLDVVTIHASQGDTEARQWEFELHNNGELIDTSEITEQLFFKAYKGGTEQILPENTSTPTTSPFKGDIKYPQGLLSDQEFLYRESPTEEDGLAKITDIKGNTLVWNQVYNVNSDRSGLGVNIKVVNGAVSITRTSTGTGTGPTFAWTDFKAVQGHKYIITKDFTLPAGDFIFDQYNLNSSTDITTVVFTVTNSGEYIIPQLKIAQADVTYNISGHLCVYDLTKMFGAGNEPTTVEEFKSLFPLPYYQFEQGKLLSFNGNGIKTVGKNLFSGAESYSRENAGYYIREGGTNNPLPLKLAKGTYTISIKSTVAGTSQLEFFSGGITSADRFLAPYIILVEGVKTYTFTIDRQSDYIRLYGSFVGTISDIQIESGSTATPYEPYTSSTLSLPISTYFPTGMKSAGSAYDELLPTKAVTRIGAVDLGSLTWTYRSQVGAGIFSASVTNSVLYKQVYTVGGLCANYTYGNTVAGASQMLNVADKSICFYLFTQEVTARTIYVKDSSFSDATAFKTAMSGVYLYYELATESETSFTTASLVTENAEIPLSNEDGVLVGKCTEQLSAEPGFHDAKIKLSDGDGECYSNKIQLHVERSPQ